MPEVKRILIVDDDAGQRGLLRSFLQTRNFSISECADGAEGLAYLEENGADMLISDIRMPKMSGLELSREVKSRWPGLPILLVTAFADIREAVDALHEGVTNYLEKPIDLDELKSIVNSVLGLTKKEEQGEDGIAVPELPEGVIAESAAMREVLVETALVAPSDSRVLISGESGTGKEVLAELIHRWSERAAAPLVKVNCAAIPENLLESELFGHEKGSFTGAVDRRIGRFEEADGGTLFLDEAGEMTAALQAKLLRVIQDGTFQRVGSNKQQHVDVRVLAATNRDLEVEVTEGRFREDLYYRLNVFEIYLPPLRERREDILPLSEAFAARFARSRPRFSPVVADILKTHQWPGNIRELRNAMERATLLSRGGTIMPEHLPRKLREMAGESRPAADSANAPSGRIEDVERDLILRTLAEQNYNRTETSRVLGISRRALQYKLRHYEEEGYATKAE